MPMASSEKPDCTARPGEAVHVFRGEDGSFAVGVGRIAIAGGDILFANNVVRDLGQLVHMPEGEEALRQGDALGRRVTIIKPEAPTEPPNAWVVPDDLAAAGNGTGCGCAVFYDPADWPRPGDPRSPSSVEILSILLRQANFYAAGKSDPSKPGWGAERPEPGR
jgi:hypothetical protein